MTVTSEVVRTDYVGTGSVAAYATTFPVKATSEVRVFKQDANGQDTELTLGVDFTAVLNTAGLCTVTLTAGNLTNGYKLSLQRGIPYTQTYNPAQSGAYNAANLGVALDRLVMEVQRLKGEVDRSIKIPYLEAGGDSVTKLDDNATTRANQALVFDASGNAIVGGTVGVSASAFAQTLLDDTSADAMRTTLGLPSQAMAARTVVANDTAGSANGTARSIDDLTVLADGSTTRRDLSARAADWLNGLDYGMVGDGVTDDLSAFQAVINASNSTGKPVFLPPKTYLVSDMVVVKSNVTIFGYGATIKAASTMTKDKIVLLYSDATYLVGIANTRTYGLTVDGNRDNRASGSNAGANFYISAGSRHLFTDCVSLNATQEGFQAAGNTGWAGGLATMVSFINCRADNCYRNGLSLTGTDRAVIIGGQYNSSNGADPQAGIDIEPNGATSPNKDFFVSGVSCKNNTKWGLALYNGTWSTGHVVGVNLSNNGICGLINTASSTAVRVQGVLGESNVTSLIATTATDANANAVDLAETSNRPIQSVAQKSSSGGTFSSTTYASSGYSRSITLPKANCTVHGMARFNCLLTESSGTVAEASIEIRDEAGTAVDQINLKIQAGGNGANALVIDVPVMLGWTQSNGSTLTKTYTAWVKVTTGTDSVQINNYSFHLLAIP